MSECRIPAVSGGQTWGGGAKEGGPERTVKRQDGSGYISGSEPLVFKGNVRVVVPSE